MEKMELSPVPALQSQSTAAHNRILALQRALFDLCRPGRHGGKGLSILLEPVEQLAGVIGDLARQLASFSSSSRRSSPSSWRSPPLRQHLAAIQKLCEETSADLPEVALPGDEDLFAGTVELVKTHLRKLAVISRSINGHGRDDPSTESVLADVGEILEDCERLVDECRARLPGHPTRATHSGNGSDPPSYETAVSGSAGVRFSAPAPPEKTGPSKKKIPGSAGLSGVFKALASLPSLLRRIEPLVSPLCRAAADGNTPVVEALLAQGANVDGRNEDGRPALVCAALAGRLDTVRLLVNWGAEMAARDSTRGLPALFHAAAAGHVDVVAFLLNRGADPNARGSFGQPFLVSALSDAPVPVLSLLFSRAADPNLTSISGTSLLLSAVQNGRADVAAVLLDAGASISASCGPSGRPLLAAAVESQDAAVVKLLLSRGARPDARLPSGRSVLLLAAEKANAEDERDMAIVRLLLDAGADVDDGDCHGSSPLAAVLARGRGPVAELLLAYGANPNVRDHSNRSLLLQAIDRGSDDHVRMLLDHGAVPSRADHSGRTVLMALLEKNPPPGQGSALLQLLVDRGADPNEKVPSSSMSVSNAPLGFCVQQQKQQQKQRGGGGGGGGGGADARLDHMRILLLARANPNAAYKGGTTPFLYAVARGDVAAVRLMGGFGADANVRDKNGNGALALAVEGGRPDVVQAVMECGARVYRGPRSQLALARAKGRLEAAAVLEDWTKSHRAE